MPCDRTLSAPGWKSSDLIGGVVLLGGGGALAWACRVHPAALPPWAPWEFSWVEFLAASLGLWWYARGLARTAASRRPSALRQASFLAGVLISYAVLQTRFDYMAQHMFFLSRVQHMTTHHLGPFLIALAWPGEMLARGMPAPLRRLIAHPIVARTMAVLQQPVLAAVLFAGLIVLWLIPAVHLRAMMDARLYAVMNGSMLGDGLLFWMLVLDPRASPPARLSYSVRIFLVMSVQVPQIMAGALIALTAQDLYPYYDLCGRLYADTGPQLDQEVGGFIIYFPGAMMSAVAALLLFRRLWHDDAAIAATLPAGGTELLSPLLRDSRMLAARLIADGR